MKRNSSSKVETDTKSVVIYHVIYSHEGFDESAQILFTLVRRAQKTQPGKKRNLYLDIEGHRDSDGSFDADMFELQYNFIPNFLARFLSEIHYPLFSAKNPGSQENDIPSELIIKQS